MNMPFSPLPILALVFVGVLAGDSISFGADPLNRTIGIPHPYHVSLTEMEWNPTTQSLEVAMWVWPADLEKALSKQLGRAVDLDTEKELDKKLAVLVNQHFRVIQKRQKPGSTSVTDKATKKVPVKSPIRWVGHELDPKQAWLYFEVKNIAKDAVFSLSNQMFFELNDDQLNQLNAKLGSHEKRLIFTLESPTQTMSINN